MTGNGLVVIGSGPTGISAAVAYREAGGTGPVRVVGADTHQPYERPPLSKGYLRGESEASEAALHPPEFYAERGIELRLDESVEALAPAAREVMLASGGRLSYDCCVIATGADPILPSIPGADGENVYLLRALAQARALRERLAGAGSAVVVGSGFIGCEAAVSLAACGLHVTLISSESLPQRARLGDRVARRLARWLRQDGVELLLGDEVLAVDHTVGGVVIRSRCGARVAADVALFATGVHPRAELARTAGLTIAHDRIAVDAGMRTSAPQVFAGGDVAFAHNDAAGRPLAVEHWGDALAMGEIAGANAAGQDRAWSSVPGFWSEIGPRILKYSAWGDGFDDVVFRSRPGGSFTAWYLTEGRTVGVLTHRADDDYELGADLIARGAPAPAPA